MKEDHGISDYRAEDTMEKKQPMRASSTCLNPPAPCFSPITLLLTPSTTFLLERTQTPIMERGKKREGVPFDKNSNSRKKTKVAIRSREILLRAFSDTVKTLVLDFG